MSSHPAHGTAIRERFATFVAAGFGSGYAARAPGSAGSATGLGIGALLMATYPPLLLPAILVATYGGLWAIETILDRPTAGAEKSRHDDPQWIVIDEIAGQLLAMLALHRLSILGLAAAFLLFRLFDITKPGPIGWADRQSGPTSIMADDLLAGLAAFLILLLGQALLGTFA
jgi:phosphatidylglycerophosphatase A